MPDAKKGARSASRTGGQPTKRSLRFGPVNYVVLAAGALTIVLGYVLLDGGSVTAAPFLLVLGYAVLLPVGLLLGWKRIGPDE